MDGTRRTLLAGIGGLAAAIFNARAAEPFPAMTVTRDPDCGCCAGWIEHIRAAGFKVDVVEIRQVNRVRTRLGIPSELASCHTAEVAGYALEGHVPAPAIKRLLRERPAATGLAVPGMPIGSPGMEVAGAPDEAYQVILFGPAGRRVYARYKGGREL